MINKKKISAAQTKQSESKDVHKRQKMDLKDLALKFGSFIGLLTLVYAAVQMMHLQPDLQFDATAPVEQSEDANTIKIHYNGILKNRSLAPNSIVKFSLSVFDMKTKERVYDSYSGDKLYKLSASGDQEIILPINLAPKESVAVDVVAYITLDGDVKQYYEQSTTQLTPNGIVEPKYAFMLLMEDVNGNVFNTEGQRMPDDYLNRRWTFPNTFRDAEDLNFLPMIKELFGMGMSLIKYKIGGILSSLGLTSF